MQLSVIVLMEALDGGPWDGPIHALDLPMGSEMLHLGQAMLDTDPSKDMVRTRTDHGLGS